MGKIDLIDNGWVDLVFEGKNQTYGAYQLRKNTGVRNLKALITMFVGFAIIAAIVIAKVSIENYIAAQNAAIEADVELASLAEKKEAKVEKKDEPEVEKIEVERVKSSVAFTVPEIKKDSEVKEDQEMKSQEELQQTNTAIGAFNVEGNDEAGGEVLKAKEVIAEPEPPKVEESKVFDVVEEGRVIVTFVVERDGSITDVKVVKSVDPSLDKEAQRVVKSMPHWIPGKQNGSAVRVKYTVPVTFRLQ